jgi:redox-sensing transcriptional repressor
MEQTSIPVQTLQRLPVFLKYLKSLPEDGASNISANNDRGGLGLSDVQVRKDLASVMQRGPSQNRLHHKGPDL